MWTMSSPAIFVVYLREPELEDHFIAKTLDENAARLAFATACHVVEHFSTLTDVVLEFAGEVMDTYSNTPVTSVETES